MSEELEKSPGVTNPLVLLQSMVERGADPDALKKMMDLAERWERNQAEKAWNEAKAMCDAEIPAAFAHNANNPQTKSGYRTFETIQPIVKPIYTKHGFSLTFSEEEPTEALMHIRADLSHRAGFTRSWHNWFPRDGTGAKGGQFMNAVQGTCSTLSYAKREMTGNIFGFAEGGQDQDGQNLQTIVTADQVREINDLFAELRNMNREVNQKRFWAWLGIEGLHELRSADYMKATQQLNRDRRMTDAEWAARSKKKETTT